MRTAIGWTLAGMLLAGLTWFVLTAITAVVQAWRRERSSKAIGGSNEGDEQ